MYLKGGDQLYFFLWHLYISERDNIITEIICQN